MKIYIASDLHIGYERSNYSKIKEFFELVKKDADRLILCGDVFDLWRCPSETIRDREPYKSTYELLLDIGNKIPTVVIFGNHDYNLYKKLNLGWIDIKDDFIEDNIYYCHGWRFDIKQRFGSYFYYWIVKYFPYLYQRFFKESNKIINKEDQIYKIHKIYDEVIKFINSKDLKYVVMGHTHNPIINDKIIDCGDFIDSNSYIIIEDGIPQLKQL